MKTLLTMLWSVTLLSLPSFAGGVERPPVEETETTPLSQAHTEEFFAHQQSYTHTVERSSLMDLYFEALKDLDLDYGKVGSVLEGLSLVHHQRIYIPDDFHVISGVSYHDAEDRTLGELDLLVLDRATGEAVLAGEVKLSKNPARAGEKAARQIKRLRDALAEGRAARFTYEGKEDVTIQPSTFIEATEYIRVGSRGALAAGYDLEIDLTRTEGDELQARILEYKNAPSAPQKVLSETK